MFKLANLYKLFTHEESSFFHLHKIVGCLSLGHFIIRFGQMFMTPHIDFKSNYITLGFIGVHMLLSASSLIFKIPNKRSLHLPMIWPEFRIHSIIFAYRSLFIMLGLWISFNLNLNLNLNLNKFYFNTFRYGIVLATLFGADAATKYYLQESLLDPSTSTMRTMPYPPNMPPKIISIMNKFYSISQILATMICLYTYSYQKLLLVLFPIQIAAFLMTLVRKNILSPGGWHLLYTGALGLNYAFGFVSKTEPKLISFWVLTSLFIVGRLRFNLNKYVLWSFVIFMKILLEKY